MRGVLFRTDEEVTAALPRVVAHLTAGGLIAYPTETVYGLGSRARGPEVQAVARLKGRRPGKPFLLLVADRDPGGSGRLPDVLRGPEGGIAVRWTSHRGMARLVRELGEPVTSTSANLPGSPPAPGAEAIVRDFAPAVEAGTLLVLDGGVLGNSPPSTVVDCTQPTPRLIREGALTLGELRRAAGRLAP